MTLVSNLIPFISVVAIDGCTRVSCENARPKYTMGRESSPGTGGYVSMLSVDCGGDMTVTRMSK